MERIYDDVVEILCREIFKYIKLEVDKVRNPDMIARVLSTKGNICTVSAYNAKYKVKNGTGIEFKENDVCLVHCINGNFQNKVIIAKL